MNIKQIVANNNMAEFTHYFDGSLWYEVMWAGENAETQKLSFPVPIDDIGNATFNRVERAILMMRYIRKHLKTLEGKQNEIDM